MGGLDTLEGLDLDERFSLNYVTVKILCKITFYNNTY